MESNGFTDRTRSQEDRYFHGLERQRKQAADGHSERAALERASGVEDDEAVDTMMAAGIRCESLDAIQWAPLVFVAWADGAVQPGERDSLLRIAEADGVPQGHPAHALLRAWLEHPPSEGLLSAWQRYMAVVGRGEDSDAREIRDRWRRTRARVREVAEASGGWLGFGKVSREEGAVMLEVERTMQRTWAV